MGKHDLQRLKPHVWLFWIVWNWSIIAAAFVIAFNLGSLIGWGVAILVIGTRQHALALLGHDGVHYLGLPNRLLNDSVATLACFYPLGGSMNAYRGFHLKHHLHLNTPDDAEQELRRKMAPALDLPVSGRALVRVLLLDLVGFGLGGMKAVIATLSPKKWPDRLGWLCFWLLTGLVLWMLGILWVLIVWFIALATANWAGFRLRIWTEHSGRIGTHRFSASWWQRWTFLPHNTWCHYEHHRSPKVPFYNLPKLRQLEASERLMTATELFRSFATSPPLRSDELPDIVPAPTS